ncbi:MAG: tyrosine-type recombinase/integrase [Ruminococcus sp.]|nr:tyrosine-type recombinase/integrase [Ruminococcus sp.]MCM1480449.1 tyrosine-type recombinase/integrase [Muribaculaceae bacterium]
MPDSGGRHVENGCKTVAGEQVCDSIMQMLSEYRAYYTKKVFEYGSKWDMSTMAVFYAPQKPGDYLSPSTVREWLDNFTKKHNLPKIHPHQFRHTSISLLLQAGVSVPDAAKRAGHSRPDVTMSIYAHTLRNNDRHCCEAVTKAIPILPKVKES